MIRPTRRKYDWRRRYHSSPTRLTGNVLVKGGFAISLTIVFWEALADHLESLIGYHMLVLSLDGVEPLEEQLGLTWMVLPLVGKILLWVNRVLNPQGIATPFDPTAHSRDDVEEGLH